MENSSSLEPTAQRILEPHQQEALAWMSAGEHARRGGGILADVMGLGKTTTILSHVHCAPRPPRADKEARGTLVIAPKALRHFWETETHQCIPNARTLVYSGGASHASDFDAYDVVICGFRRAVIDAHLKQHKWVRLVIDEAHVTRNHTTQIWDALCDIQAGARWLLTGTPINTSWQDMAALCGVIGDDPYCRLAWWRKQAKLAGLNLPAKNEIEGGTTLGSNRHAYLRWLHSYVLRRTKKTIEATPLPALRMVRAYCRPSLQEKKWLDALARHAKGMSDLRRKGLTLVCTTRIRRAAVHPALALLSTAAFDLLGKCWMCGHDENVSALPCGIHWGCSSLTMGPCMACDMVAMPPSDSCKMKAMWQYIATHLQLSGEQSAPSSAMPPTVPRRLIVFSQWTQALDLAEKTLETKLAHTGLRWVRMDGDTRESDRENTLNKFREDPSVRILLATYGVAAFGHDFTVAQLAIALDESGNPAVQDQASKRCCRPGQTESTRFITLVADNVSYETERLPTLHQRRRAQQRVMLTQYRRPNKKMRTEAHV